MKFKTTPNSKPPAQSDSYLVPNSEEIRSPISEAFSRNEALWLVGAIVFGIAVRIAFPGRMAVEHFDEGVYASNFWFGSAPGETYPMQHLYAPPLLPFAIEWTMIIASLCGIKPTGFVPMIPSLLMGIATIPSIWWIGRRWFGATAGLSMAWLVATSDFHACYSRAALTDVPVCFLILWSVYFVWQAFASTMSAPQSGDRRSNSRTSVQSSIPSRAILFAGLFTGLAWWTKYNGWLPLAIGLAGGVLWQLKTPAPERQIGRVFTCWVLIAVVAAIVWSPVMWGLEKHGGYASVAANHRQYVVGFQGWKKSAFEQLKNIGGYDNPLELFRLPFGDSNANQIPAREIDLNLVPLYFRTGDYNSALEVSQKFLFLKVVPFVIPLLSLAISIWICFRTLFLPASKWQPLPACLVAAWFGGMTIATPFYYPYPRLILPWLCSTWFCIGLAMQIFSSKQLRRMMFPFRDCPLTILVIFLATGMSIRLVSGTANSWKDRTAMQAISERFARVIRQETARSGGPENEALVYVYAEPAIVLGLRAEGLAYVGPAQDAGSLGRDRGVPTFAIFSTAYVANLSAEDRQKFSPPHLERVADSEIPLRSHMVINDNRGQSLRPENVNLFRVRR